MTTAGLILAGGQGRRLGGRDKALVELGGKPLIAYVHACLARQTAPVLISAAGDPRRFAGFAAQAVLADDLPGFQGPLAGIVTGLDWLARSAPTVTHMLSLPVDTPFAPDDLASGLRGAMPAGIDVPVTAFCGGRLHPAVTLWPLGARGALRHMVEEEQIRAVTQALTRLGGVARAWDQSKDDPFFNINSADDLARAHMLLAGRSGLDD
ncbi:MAG: molybdenum cofactor guanylyltransferase [Hyphomicrobiales bacterium]|nr:molybdenum cofactor guanylyltransferase [Hyphomicrobiales bacterium]